jgi:hypothetical protein
MYYIREEEAKNEKLNGKSFRRENNICLMTQKGSIILEKKFAMNS